MIRRITCPTCGKWWKDREGTHPADEEGPEETVKVLAGVALGDMRCDECNYPLRHGDAALAVSVYTERNPYTPWEASYVRKP